MVLTQHGWYLMRHGWTLIGYRREKKTTREYWKRKGESKVYSTSRAYKLEMQKNNA